MKLALVTGGADGIGLAICKKLSVSGYHVISLDVKEAKEKFLNVTNIICDIRDEMQIDSALKNTECIDLLINNAAVQIESPFISQTNNQIKDVINTNVLGTLFVTIASLKKMKEGSQIFNIGSIHGEKPRKNKLTYDISKAGLNMLTKSLALELAPTIRVNQLNIGAVFTPMNRVFDDNEKLVEQVKSKIPLNHILSSDEVASVVIKLIEKDFVFMTGSIINFDCGRSLI